MKIINLFKSNSLPQIALGVMFCTLLFLASASLASAQSKSKKAKPKVQTATVIVNEMGYQPASLRLKKGIPARLKFLRQTEKTCATAVVFKDYGINRDLPLNQAVIINFTPKKAGEFTFACGMGMVRGKLIVK